MTPFSLKTSALLVGLLTLAGCQDKAKETKTEDAMVVAGYSRAPEIGDIVMAGSSTFVVTGLTIPNARVRFGYGGNRAIGVTSDSKGNFRAELPSSPLGGVYDLSTEDGGRLMHADGRLFIPPGNPEKAVLMRPGASSVPVLQKPSDILVVDYDAAGAFALAGRVAPNTEVKLVADVVTVRQMSDAGGYFSAVMQIPRPEDGAVSFDVSVEAGGHTWTRNVSATRIAENGDKTTAILGGWRVEWVLPGGGMQTTLVF